MNKLAIIGASGHGKVVAELAELNGYCVEFVDDKYPNFQTVENWRVIGTLKHFLENYDSFVGAVIAIGDSNIRKSIACELNRLKIETPSLVHPNANVSKYAKVDVGTVVFAGAVINAFASVGEHCIINSNSVIEHDCLIGNYCHICPGASLAGGVIFGEHVWFGIGSTSKQLISVGRSATIGAGSVVVSDIPSDSLVYGNPAKKVIKS